MILRPKVLGPQNLNFVACSRWGGGAARFGIPAATPGRAKVQAVLNHGPRQDEDALVAHRNRRRHFGHRMTSISGVEVRSIATYLGTELAVALLAWGLAHLRPGGN